MIEGESKTDKREREREKMWNLACLQVETVWAREQHIGPAASAKRDRAELSYVDDNLGVG